MHFRGRSIIEKIWDSITQTLFILGVAIVIIACARNTLTWFVSSFFCLFLSNTDTIGMLKLLFEGLCKHVGALPVRSGSVSGIKCLTSLKAMLLRLRFTVSYVLILARMQLFMGEGRGCKNLQTLSIGYHFYWVNRCRKGLN